MRYQVNYFTKKTLHLKLMNSYDLEQLQRYAVLKMCGFAVNLYAADDFSVLYSTLEIFSP